MAAFAFQPARPLASDAAELSRALQRAQVKKSDLIRVTGPAGLTAMLWLCRNGYEEAVFVRSESLHAQGPADALLIPHPCSARELAELLGQLGESLREGGAVIVQAGSSDPTEGHAMLLEPLGYRIEHRLADKGRAVLIARRVGVGGFRKAA